MRFVLFQCGLSYFSAVCQRDITAAKTSMTQMLKAKDSEALLNAAETPIKKSQRIWVAKEIAQDLGMKRLLPELYD